MGNMRKSSVFKGIALSAFILAGGFAGAPLPTYADNDKDDEDQTETAVWSRQDAQDYELTKKNTAPDIDNVDEVAPDYWVWDTWPLRDRDGSIAKVDGYQVVFALTASREYTWSGRHDEAKIRYFYSKDGKNWEMGGLAYDPDDALGSRQWAGSAMMEEDGKVHLFYTASGRKGEEETTFEQRLAKTTFDIEGDKKSKSVELSNFGSHEILAEADGEYYETQEQKTGDIIYSFRDPWFFQDPNSGKEYLIFEGNTAGDDKSLDSVNIGDEDFREDHDVPDGAENYNGNIGIAEAEDDDLTEFELLPPLLEADGVNQQLERPHILVKDGNYYLFTISHKFTFAPGLTGPDGLYGFMNDSLRGDYEALNDNGLVLANPEDDPFMTYSHAVMPNGDVISFVNEYRDENGDLQYGGTFAPTLKMSIKGDKTKLKGSLAPGQIIPSSTESGDHDGHGQDNESVETTNWTREDVSSIEQNKKNTAPEINTEDLEQIAPDYHIWDTWPLRKKDGSIATVNGYKVIFSLTAPSDVLPGKRHDIAEIRYFYSKNGKDWKLGGKVFEDGEALGSRQWAGSAMLEDDEIHFFYTATGRKGEENLTYEQRLAKASAELEVEDGNIEFDDWTDHEIILEPDGELYQTMEQSKQGDIAYAFRDPWFFEDPKSGEEYILFEGNSAGTPDERSIEQEHVGSEDFADVNDVPEDAKLYNGSIGIAKAEDDDYDEFEIMPPLMEANSVNQELERPHIVTKGNKYYLFTDTHKNKFAPGLTGPDGLYGFVSDSLTADYEPLNGSGLVVANPEDEPYQTYSWMVMPNGTVISFANFYDLNGLTIDELGAQSEEYQFEHFGGTLAPSLKLSIHKDKTSIKKELDAGVFK